MPLRPITFQKKSPDGVIESCSYKKIPNRVQNPPPGTVIRDHLVATPDGTSYLLIQQVSPRTLSWAHPPIIGFPGLGMNADIFLASNTKGLIAKTQPDSIATYLNSIGREVYLVHPSNSANAYKKYVTPHLGVPDPSTPPPNFEKMLAQEVQGSIHYILETTGASRADWMGLSLGGVFAYALLSENPEAPIGRVVTIGSPIEFKPGFDYFAQNPIMSNEHLLDKENTHYLTYTSIGQYVEAMNPALGKTFHSWIAKGDHFPYPMEEIHTPFLLIYGEEDPLAPPTSVEKAAKRLTHAEVEIMAFPYKRHLDPLLGKNCQQVYEKIGEFFLND